MDQGGAPTESERSFQLLTLHLDTVQRRSAEERQSRDFEVDEDEDALEAMLEANANRHEPPEEEITAEPAAGENPEGESNADEHLEPEEPEDELPAEPDPLKEGTEDETDEEEQMEDEDGPTLLQRLVARWEERQAERKARRERLKREKAAAAQQEAEERERREQVARAARQEQEKVIPMPEAKPSLLQKKIDAWREQADEFAGTMFRHDSEEEEAEEAVYQQVERLIPGTDEEQVPSRPKPRREKTDREKAKVEKAAVRRAPDTSPKQLYRIYEASYKSGHGRLPFQFLLAVLLLAVTAIAGGELPFAQVPFLQDNLKLTGIILVLGLLAASAAGLDTLLEGIMRLARRHPGLNTLSSIGVVLAIIDGVWYTLLGREGPLPFCGFAALSLWAVAWGNCRKKRGLRDACEDAYCRSQFERLTMDENKWNGKGVFVKEPGSAKNFGSQIQEPDGVERACRYVTPVMMIACFLFGILSVVGQKNPQQLIWSWSVIFVLATPLSATLAYGLPYSKLVKRLHRSGAILAGWVGIASMQGDAGIVLTDRDLFPDGSVQFTGIHNFGDVSLEKLTGCTASVIREADMGLAKIFDDQVRIQGGFYRRVDDLNWSEEGGFTGMIRGDTVMIGTAGYLQVHGISIDPGYQVRNAVFCVINDRLQGSFALNYSLPRAVRPTVHALLSDGIHPILATRDFNITPEVLRQRFKLQADRMQYPAVERRHELSAKGQPHNSTLGALIFREGIAPYADAIIGGRRMRSVVRLNALLTAAGSVVGALLGFYLTLMSAYGSLSLVNILFFLLMWLVPTVLISNGVDQF